MHARTAAQARPPALAAGTALAIAGAALAWSMMAGHVPRHLAMLLIVSPLLEEAVFRAGLQEMLMRRWPARRLLANGATALAFGAAHAWVRADPAGLAAALPALLTGGVYARTGRLRDCVALHAAMNAVWLGWNAGSAVIP